MSAEHKFVRTPGNPGALVNTDDDGLNAYRLKKKRSQAIDSVIAEQNRIKEEMMEIKDLLNRVLEKLDKA